MLPCFMELLVWDLRGFFRSKASASICIALVFFVLTMHAAALCAPGSVHLRGIVADENGSPVANLEVVIQSPGKQIQTLHTDVSGVFEYSGTDSGEYHLSLNKAGFFRVTDQICTLKEGDNEIAFTVNHETEIHEEVEVYSTSEDIQPLVTTHSEALIAREIRDIPVPTTHDLKSSLVTLPEVLRDNSGQLHIAGGRTGETQYLLDGFDIGDPSTGDLTVRVNVDSVREVEVESGRFGAQYGRAGAGVLALDTAVGDDRWRAAANNFFPGISTQRGLHITSWYPRLALSGPIHKERAWFSEALSVQHTLSLINELPRDANSVSQWSGDSMLRTQIKLTPKHLLQGNFLYNQRRASNLGLGPFSPLSTTRNARAYRSFLSFKDQILSGRTFYEFGLAADFGHDEVLPNGLETYRLTPEGSSGNYFETLRQKTRRWQAIGSVSMPTRHWHGTHDLQFGFNAAQLSWKHSAMRNAIEVIRSDGSVAQHTDFYGTTTQYRLTDNLVGIYAYDVWRVHRALVLQFGIRTDWDQALETTTPSPRISANYLPFKNNGTKLTASWGVFLQPAILSNLGPAYDQQRADLFYPAGESPPQYHIVLSIFHLPAGHLKQPRFNTASFAWEQSIGKKSQAEVNLTLRNGRFGLAYDKAPDSPSVNFFVLSNNRRDRYRSLLVSFRHSFTDKTAVTASYMRSSTRTNRVFDYSLDTLLFSPQQSGPLEWDAPNRFVSSGWMPLPVWNLLASYFFEYRTGFPFSIVNEQQQLVGPANGSRFPKFACLNFGLEKRIRLFTREWAIRIAILDVTSHSNPDSVINNIDSPKFMKFAGGQRRAFNARIRLVG
jgi:hypothetical protein